MRVIKKTNGRIYHPTQPAAACKSCRIAIAESPQSRTSPAALIRLGYQLVDDNDGSRGLGQEGDRPISRDMVNRQRLADRRRSGDRVRRAAASGAKGRVRDSPSGTIRSDQPPSLFAQPTSAAKTAAATNASSRSRTPPWPGIRRLESLTAKRRLTADSARSRSGRRSRRRRRGKIAARSARRRARRGSRRLRRWPRRRRFRRSRPTRSCPARRAATVAGRDRPPARKAKVSAPQTTP